MTALHKPNMAARANVDVEAGGEARLGLGEKTASSAHGTVTAEKRKSGGLSTDGEPAEKKKFSVNLNSKSQTGTSTKGLSISLGSSGRPPTTQPEHKPPGAVNQVKMSLGSKPVKEPAVTLKKTSATVASVFNDDDDSDEEEMPPEAKMRMKNIGRNTPTAAGPNSFGKGRLGFCDQRKALEKEIKEQLEKEEKN